MRRRTLGRLAAGIAHEINTPTQYIHSSIEYLGDAIDIADTGTGIAAEDRDRVFDPFYTTKAIGEGTGQGLAIARASFESEVGHGTVFHLCLPIHRREVGA